MPEAIPIYVGYDQRESVAYHVFCQSVLARASIPVAFYPLALNMLGGFDGRGTGTNDFNFSRFLIPWLHNWTGFAIFCDGDMVVNADIAELWSLRDPHKSVQVVKHDYQTKHPVKYLGNKNEDYPRKNWSSVMIWNCASYPNRKLKPEFVAKQTGAYLHRFEWLQGARIGELPADWNFLVSEYPKNPNAKLFHYTLGIPSFSEFSKCDHADKWHAAHYEANYFDTQELNGPPVK